MDYQSVKEIDRRIKQLVRRRANAQELLIRCLLDLDGMAEEFDGLLDEKLTAQCDA